MAVGSSSFDCIWGGRIPLVFTQHHFQSLQDRYLSPLLPQPLSRCLNCAVSLLCEIHVHQGFWSLRSLSYCKLGIYCRFGVGPIGCSERVGRRKRPSIHQRWPSICYSSRPNVDGILCSIIKSVSCKKIVILLYFFVFF